MALRKCEQCGSEFTPKCRGQKYCTGLCYEMAMEQKGKEEAQMTRVPKSRNATCPTCGQVFERTYNSQIYCSKKCKQINANKKGYVPTTKPLKDMSCKWCGSVFQAAYKRKYCTTDCRDMANGKRKKQKEPVKSLVEIAKLSRELGMTYGQYMAKYGYEEEKQNAIQAKTGKRQSASGK